MKRLTLLFAVVLACMGLSAQAPKLKPPIYHPEPVHVRCFYDANGILRVEGPCSSLCDDGKQMIVRTCAAAKGTLILPPTQEPKPAKPPFRGPVIENLGTPHRWASDLDGKVEKDRCRWVANYGITPTVQKECPTGHPEVHYDLPGISLGFDHPSAWKATETYILDWCLEHGETRVIRKEQKEPTKP